MLVCLWCEVESRAVLLIAVMVFVGSHRVCDAFDSVDDGAAEIIAGIGFEF